MTEKTPGGVDRAAGAPLTTGAAAPGDQRASSDVAATSAPLLALHGVSREFGGRGRTTTALDGVDIAVHEGRSVGIVGESGAGKSTLLRLLLGLDTPTSGQVSYRGQTLDRRDRALLKRFRREVQVVLQDPRSSLDPRMTVAQIVAEPLQSLRIGADQRERSARVDEVLGWVGLDADARRKYPAQFSGGQRQRIAIARALAPSPKVLVGDEPVSALDVSVRQQIMELLARLRTELGLTLVLVSHDVAIVGQLCEETVVLRGGRVEEAGQTRQVLTRPTSPYTRALLDAVPTLG
ncbi:ABC transporter ATP-binding protein [Sanguibacter inulinus]|uniref:ABC transporter ATP-binding protein n=1 Tax=Sanguibacter inulinus TaxID=60922 RepID=UPI001D16D7F0|nr:ABC transporter ATP-binding protein [Sanguibacter inulinus]